MRYLVACCLVFVLAVIGCKKNGNITFPPLIDYYPLQVGKTFTYRLDSILPANFGTTLQTKYYLAKDSVESKFFDATGRESYRIWRYTRDTLQTQPWTYKSTYVTTFDNNQKQVEYVDNNLRFITLHEPIREGFSWNGNSYIETKTGPFIHMDGWSYTYENVGLPYTVRKGKFDTTISILHIDEVTPPGPFNPSFYQQTNYSVEVYAKGVGLIYKEFLHKTWQVTPNGHYDDDSYGLKLNLVDYK
jgi:hypothetical protein